MRRLPTRGRLPFWQLTAVLVGVLVFLTGTGAALAHGVDTSDAGYIAEISGINLLPYVYLGAKHMITGYDHILFLFGVVFFLYRMEHIGLYVSLFAVGHSTTMLLGVLLDWAVSSYFIDAIIALSVVYKALDNIGALQRWLGFQPDTKAATLIFGLFHGLGLATKVLDYDMSADGLLANLIAFNVGVEIGQMLALATILIAMGFWRRARLFWKLAYSTNVVMMCAGFVLFGYQLVGLIVVP